MVESTALVPIPFFPPARIGTGLLLKFSETSKRPLLLEPLARTVAPEADEGMAYSGDGRFIADTWIGTLLNIYV